MFRNAIAYLLPLDLAPSPGLGPQVKPEGSCVTEKWKIKVTISSGVRLRLSVASSGSKLCKRRS